MKSREMRKTDKGQHCAGICHLPALKRLGCKESASLNTTPMRRASSLLTQESILRWSEAHGNVPALAINSIPRGQKKKKNTECGLYSMSLSMPISRLHSVASDLEWKRKCKRKNLCRSSACLIHWR